MIKKDGLFLFFYRLFASFAIKYVFLISDRMKRLLLLVLWVWVACFTAASHNYMFKHLEVKDGLSNNQVNAIYKDSHGFMWFGTASGLNRYDGYDTRIYRSLKDDAIRCRIVILRTFRKMLLEICGYVQERDMPFITLYPIFSTAMWRAGCGILG